MARKTDDFGVTIADYKRTKGLEPALCGQIPDNVQLISDSLQSLKNFTSNQKRYADTPEGFENFKQMTIGYFTHLQEVNSNPAMMKNRLLADLEGWAVWGGLTRGTILSYEKRGGPWFDFIQLVKNAIFSIRKQDANSLRAPVVGLIFDATNNYGYANASEFRIAENASAEKKTISIEQLPSFDELPVLLDEKGNAQKVIDADLPFADEAEKEVE